MPEFPALEIVVSSSDARQTLPQPDALTLVEDGVDGPHAKSVASFESKGYGLAAVVVVDVSGSMAGRPLGIVRESLQKFVADARPQDSVGVLTIADDAVFDVPFGSSAETMKQKLAGMKIRGTKTRLYDGLVKALGSFEGSLPARRELTVISDGHDEGSRAKLESVIELAHERRIAIDAVGLTQSSPVYLRVLSRLAAETGGSFHQVHSDQELERVIGSGMKRLKATPVASFEAERVSADGKEHRLGVRWSGTATAFGETAWVAPERSAATVLHGLRRLPAWAFGWALAAAAGLAMAFVARRRGSRRPAGAVDYAVAPLPGPVPAAVQPGGGKTQFEGSGAANGYPSVQTPRPMKVAEAAPMAAEAGRTKTRIAGVFPANRRAVAALTVLTGPMTGRVVPMAGGQFWIGASLENNLALSEDAAVSGRHAYLVFEEPILLLVDNHSTNGTRIGGRLMERGGRQPLREGDQIQVGQTLLRVGMGL